MNEQNNRNPWIYISSYEKTDAKRFKGREAETQKFLDLVNQGVMAVLYANSGIGKSSFLKAGIIPQMEEKGYYAISVLFPDEVFEAKGDFTKWLLNHVKSYFDKQELKDCFWESTVCTKGLSEQQKTLLKKCDDSLWWWLHTHRINNGGRHCWPLLIFDQFEEVFTRNGDEEEKKKLEALFKTIQEMAWDSVPDEVMFNLNQLIDDGVTPELDRRAYYKLIFSLRKEYLAEFDYWGNERFNMRDLLHNRMLLLPFSRQQAELVITQQPADELKGTLIITLNQIKDDIINRIDANRQNEVEPLLLSVLCSQLYNEAVRKGKTETGLSKEDLDEINLDQIIRDFYEQQVKAVLKSEQLVSRMENALIDEKGLRKRPEVKSIGLPADTLKQLVDAHIVRTEFPIIEEQEMKGWVEIIHDRVAEVVHQKKEEQRHKQNSRRFRSVTICALLLLALATLYWGNKTSDKNSINSNLVNCDDHYFSTDDSQWIASQCLSDNSLVEYFSVIDVDTFSIKNCPYLTVVDLSKLKRDSLKLNLSDCQLLSQIVLPEELACLDLHISKCSKLEIKINSGLGALTIDAPNDKLDFSVDRESKDKFVWRDNILWDIENRCIVYFDPTEQIIPNVYGHKIRETYFPVQIRNKSLNYHGITFKNLMPQDDQEEMYGSGYSIDFSNVKRMVTSSDIDITISKVTLPSEMSFISNGLCCGCYKLETVILPKNLGTIGSEAFKDCRKLNSIIFPQTLTTIGDQAFKNCRKLKQIVIPASVQTIGSEAFAGCDSLESVVFEGNSVKLGKRAFANCRLLKRMKLPENTIFTHTGYFDSPFLDCPELNDKSKLESDEQPPIIAKDGNTQFFLSRDIVVSDETTELHIPYSLPRINWKVIGNLTSLTDIFVPYPQPESKNHYVLNGIESDDAFNLDISDDMKNRIILHVPAGCRRYYESSPEFARYSHIEEMTAWQTHMQFARSVIYEAYRSVSRKLYLKNVLFVGFCFCWGLLVLCYCSRLKKESLSRWRQIVGALGFSLWTVIVYLVLNWFLRLLLQWDDYAIPVAGIVSIILVSACYLSDQFHKICIPLSQLFNTWKVGTQQWLKRCSSAIAGKTKYLLITIGLALLAIFVWKECKPEKGTVSQQMERHAYKAALQQLSSELLSADSISASDVALLKELLMLTGSSASLETVSEYTYDLKSGGSWGRGIGRQSGEFSVHSGNNIFSWNHQGMVSWNMDYDPFGGGSKHVFNMMDRYITYYNEAKDSSVIVWLSSESENNVLTRVDGKISDVAKSAELIFTDTPKGRMVFDYKGRGVKIPAKRSYWHYYQGAKIAREVGESSKESHSTWSTDNKNSPSTVYCNSTDGPVYHIFEKGDVVAFLLDRFLVWDNGDNGITVYDIQNNFKPIFGTIDLQANSVKTNGEKLLLERRNKYSVIYDLETGDTCTINGSRVVFEGDYLFTHDNRLYNINTMESWGLGKKYSNMGSWSASMTDNRYLLLNDLDYKLVHVFDMQRKAQLIGEIKGVENCLLDGYLCVVRNDSLCFYRLAEERIIKGASMPKSIAETGYRSGNFVIDICTNEGGTTDLVGDKQYIVYPLDDSTNHSYSIRSGGTPVGFGDHLAYLAEGNKVIILLYTGLESVINTSPVLSDKTKELLISKLRQKRAEM